MGVTKVLDMAFSETEAWGLLSVKRSKLSSILAWVRWDCQALLEES